MFIRLDKEDSFYRSGETVKGSVFFELFHDSAANELFIIYEGVAIVPRHIKKKLINDDDDTSSTEQDSDSSQKL